MTDDLTTLLRDAGREPTIDLDVDAVHTRGRRRTVLRRATVLTASAVAIGAVVLGGVAVLSPSSPGVEVADQPSPGASGVATVEELLRSGADEGRVTLEVTASAVAGVTGADLVGLQWQQSDGAFDVTRHAADGGWSTWEVATGTPAGPVVANDASVWWLSEGGTLRRAAAGGGDPVDVLGPDTEHGWLPVGTVADTDQVIVTQLPVAEQVAERRNGLGLVAPDGTFSDVPVGGEPEVFAAGAIVDAHVASEAVVLAVATDDALLVFGARLGETLALVTELPRTDERAGLSVLAGVGIVGQEIWVVEPAVPEGTGMSVHVHDLDGGADRRTTFAIPATFADGRWPTGLSVSPSGTVALLRTTDTATFEPGTLAMFPTAPDGDPWRGVRQLDTPGIMSAIRAPQGPDPSTEEARCATEPYAQELDAQAMGAVWFPCAGTAGDDRQVSMFPVERFPDADFASEVARLEAHLGALFEGPTTAERALGLEPVVSPDVATLGDVGVDGAAVTVDLEPGEQVGVLGTTYAGAVFDRAVAAAVLQFTGYDQVRITLDGSCEAWGALRQTEGCPVLTSTHTPWG